MEILSQTDHYFEFYGELLFIGLFLIFCFVIMVAFLYFMIKEKDFKLNTIAGTFVFTIMTVLFLIGFVSTINDGVRITYNSKVTDWNKVYDQGFKVIGQEGNIITLEKGE